MWSGWEISLGNLGKMLYWKRLVWIFQCHIGLCLEKNLTKINKSEFHKSCSVQDYPGHCQCCDIWEKQKCKYVLMLSHTTFPTAMFASGLTDPETVWLETMDYSSMNFLSWFLNSREHFASSALCSRTFPGLNVFDWKNIFFNVCLSLCDVLFNAVPH